MHRGLHEALVGPEGDVPTKPLDRDDRELACDLLGLRPEQRQGRLPIDPPRVKGDEPKPNDAEIAAFQFGFIAGEIEQLERYAIEELIDRDEEDQVATAMGVGVGIDPTTRLIRRYQSEARRQMDIALSELKALQELGGQDDSDEPAPDACDPPVTTGSDPEPAAPATHSQPPPAGVSRAATGKYDPHHPLGVLQPIPGLDTPIESVVPPTGRPASRPEVRAERAANAGQPPTNSR
jgi:hypothetical protein